MGEGREASDKLRALAENLGLLTENGVGVPSFWYVYVSNGKVISFHPLFSNLEIKYGYLVEPRRPITAQKAISLMRKAAR